MRSTTATFSQNKISVV